MAGGSEGAVSYTQRLQDVNRVRHSKAARLDGLHVHVAVN